MRAGDPVLPTVSGAIVRPRTGVRLDAHGHAWIAPPSLVDDIVPPLVDEARLAAGLARFAAVAAPRRAALLDVQAPGCGRDAAALARLTAKSGVAIAALTGFHLARSYPKGLRPWTTADAALGTFMRELEGGLREAPMARAAAIKTAFTGTPEDGDPCWDGAIEASARTGALLVVHTDGGAGVEDLVEWLHARGVPPERLYLLDVDQRDDAALHRDLARAGVLLGFASSLRDDDGHAEPYALLDHLLEAGCARSIALGLDLGAPTRWAAVAADAAAAGPAALVTVVEARLQALGASENDIDALLGGSLLERAARPEVPFGLGG
jgi:predicted metal-dependent phosphotriesterase family hydrolase